MMIDTLVLSGGSSKVIATLGVLQRLQDDGQMNLKNIKNFYGTSAGALVCAFLSVGFSIKNIVTIFEETKIKPNDLKSIMQQFSLLPEDVIAREMNKYFNTTFQELKHTSDVELHVYCTNVSRNRSLVCNYITTPDMDVSAAVTMSMSIPPLFPSFSYNGDAIIDGGFVNNFPVLDAYRHRCKEPYRILGVLVKSKPASYLNVNKLNYIFHSFIQTVDRLQRLQFDLLPPELRKRCVVVVLKDTSSFAYDLDKHIIRELYFKGYYSRTTAEFLK